MILAFTPRVHAYDGYPGDADGRAPTLRVHARGHEARPLEIPDGYGHGGHHYAGASVRAFLSDGDADGNVFRRRE